MSPAELMKKFGFLNWKAILVGVIHDWISLQDIINEADKEISLGKQDKFLIEISLSRKNKDVLIKAIETYLNDTGINVDEINSIDSKELKRWRLCFLISVVNSHLPDDVKVEKIQEIYSQFGFPEDMINCTPYHFTFEEIEKIKQKQITASYSSPLESTKKLINRLREEVKD